MTTTCCENMRLRCIPEYYCVDCRNYLPKPNGCPHQRVRREKTYICAACGDYLPLFECSGCKRIQRFPPLSGGICTDCATNVDVKLEYEFCDISGKTCEFHEVNGTEFCIKCGLQSDRMFFKPSY